MGADEGVGGGDFGLGVLIKAVFGDKGMVVMGFEMKGKDNLIAKIAKFLAMFLNNLTVFNQTLIPISERGG